MMVVMSMPDALEITLITLLLFKFQAYSTSPSLLPQADYYLHILITTSVNYTPDGIDQCPVITSQEVLLPTRLAPYTHTVQPHCYNFNLTLHYFLLFTTIIT
jgi:hypothetical protein